MADYFPVISRAVSGLDPNTGETRRKVYERARAAIVKQLRAIEPPVSEEDISRERMQLEEAIRRVENEAAGRDAPAAATKTAPPVPSMAPAPNAAPPVAPQPQRAPSADATPGDSRPSDSRPNGGKSAEGKSKNGNGNGKGGGGGGKGKRSSGPAEGRPATRADGRPIVQPAGKAQKQKSKGRSGPLVALGALAAIAIVAGLFAARGQIAELFSRNASTETAQTTPDAKPADDKPAEGQPAAPAADAKSDDRLPQEQAGQEPPAAEKPAEQASQEPPAEPAAPPAEPAAPPADQQARAPEAAPAAPAQAAPEAPPQQSGPLVAQRAVLYEEGPNQQSGEALSGSILWRTESVSGGQNQPLDTALRGEIDIPARNLRAVVTIRRNTDPTLPASHTIEIQFTLPPDFPNAGIANVPGVLMKTDESARGAAVAGLSVKVTNGFFLIGLSNVDSEKSGNEQLLRDRSWIDIPILYDNGRRAVLTLEKGTPGKQAFDQAFDAWKSASAASNPPR